MYYTINKRSTFNADLFSGEEGIRTPVTLAGKHIFETCAIIHSATSPEHRNYISFLTAQPDFMRGFAGGWGLGAALNNSEFGKRNSEL